MTSEKKLWVALIAVAIIAIGGYWYPQVEKLAGSITTGTNFKYGISVGNTASLGVVPTNFSKIFGGTCSLIAPVYTVTASSTVAMDCAITGAVSTDLVDAWFATSTATGAGWSVVGSSASSTAGFITLRVVNNTGTNAIIPASIASSTDYWIFATQ